MSEKQQKATKPKSLREEIAIAILAFRYGKEGVRPIHEQDLLEADIAIAIVAAILNETNISRGES